VSGKGESQSDGDLQGLDDNAMFLPESTKSWASAWHNMVC